MTALAIIHKQDIIQRLSSGETATDIAKSYGLKSHSAISNVLADDPDYIHARIQFHTARLDNVEGEIREAADMLTLARTRELATMYRWRAERECRDLYGKDTTTATANVSLTFNLSSSTLTRASDLLNTIPSTNPKLISTPPPGQA